MAKVFGLHTLELKTGVDEKEFEAFITQEVTPLYQRVPGQIAYLMKGDRGERSGKYLIVIELESPQTRDQIYPSKGDSWGLSEEAEHVLADTEPIWEKLSTFVVDFPDAHFTDYVAVIQ